MEGTGTRRKGKEEVVEKGVEDERKKEEDDRGEEDEEVDSRTYFIAIQNLMELYEKGHMKESKFTVKNQVLQTQYRNRRLVTRGRVEVPEGTVTEEGPHGEGSETVEKRKCPSPEEDGVV
jgi:hypothetical protein